MEWFRWYHGTSVDPKMALIARRSNHTTAEVLAVWAMLLERASQEEDRGSIAGFDLESADVMLQLPDGSCAAIVQAMEEKGLVQDGRIAKWEARQSPGKAYRSSTQRVQKYRARQKALSEASEGQNGPDNRTGRNKTVPETGRNGEETPGNTPETLRGEKRRKEEKREDMYSPDRFRETEPDCNLVQEPAYASFSLRELPLCTGEMHVILQEDLEYWQVLYPAVDVAQELRNMRGWLEVNPKRRKSPQGIDRFIQGWLCRVQDRAPARERHGPRELTPYQQERQEQRELAAALLAAERELALEQEREAGQAGLEEREAPPAGW